MTVFRSCAVLAAFAGIALVVVGLRTEQTRCAARALRIDAQWSEQRRELWNLQTRVSRLRAPGRVHERVMRFATGVVPPGDLTPAPAAMRAADCP